MKYAVFKNPANDYERVVERYSLRRKKKNPHVLKKDLIKGGHVLWNTELKKKPEKIKEYLKLQPGEKYFQRYTHVFSILERGKRAWA